MTWTLLRRRALAAAMRREAGTDSLIKVLRVPAEGDLFHLHPSDAQHENDSFTRGIERIGPLGYSVLRGRLLISDHLDRRLEALASGYEQEVAGVIGAREEGVDDPEWLYRDRARLIFWDVLGFLHQTSEQLASLFDAWQRWERGDGDLGELLVTSEIQAWKTIGSAQFGSKVIWRRALGVPRSRVGMRALSDEQKLLLAQLTEESERLMLADVDLLRSTMTRDLHRVAIRYKHSYPILSASHGVVWLGDNANLQAQVRRLVRANALIVADVTAERRIEQLVVPVTIGAIENLFDAAASALRLARLLSAAILGPAESATRRTVTIYPGTGAIKITTADALLNLVAAYSGSMSAPGVLDEAVAKAQSQARIEGAARRVLRNYE